MVGAGVTHFVASASYERIVTPVGRGDARRVVLASGAAEIACGALLSSRRTGRLGACLTATLLVAVFPANVQMALDAGTERQAVPDMPVGVSERSHSPGCRSSFRSWGWALRVAKGR